MREDKPEVLGGRCPPEGRFPTPSGDDGDGEKAVDQHEARAPQWLLRMGKFRLLAVLCG